MPLFIGLPTTQISKLQNIVNSAAHLIRGVKKFGHITPVLKDLHWLPIKCRIQFKLLCMTFNALNGQAPQYLSDALTPYVPTRALRSADHKLLCIPKTRTKRYRLQAFDVAAPTYYNNLPLDICSSTSLDMFKRRLKAHFFKLSYL